MPNTKTTNQQKQSLFERLMGSMARTGSGKSTSAPHSQSQTQLNDGEEHDATFGSKTAIDTPSGGSTNAGSRREIRTGSITGTALGRSTGSNKAIEMQDVVHDSRPPSVESVTAGNGKMHRLKPMDMDNNRNNRSWSPSPYRRTHSPQPYYRDSSPLPPRRAHDIGFSDAVSDMVDIVKHETSRRGRARAKLRGDEYSLSPVRSRTPMRMDRNFHSRVRPTGSHDDYDRRNYRSASISPDRYGDDGASPCGSPVRSARLPAIPVKRGYRSATNSLEEHPSRSPSPDQIPAGSKSRGLVREGSLSQHSYPTLPQRRTGGRRLPPTPRKPSTLNLGVVGSVVLATQRLPRSPTAPHISGALMAPGGNINFPKLSPSPTHPPRSHQLPAIPLSAGGPRGVASRDRLGPRTNRESDEYLPAPRAEPMSFEQALAIGRGTGGRQLPSPMPNGYKPGQQSAAAHTDPTAGERRDLRDRFNRRSLRDPRPIAGGRTLHGDERRHSDSDEDDWC